MNKSRKHKNAQFRDDWNRWVNYTDRKTTDVKFITYRQGRQEVNSLLKIINVKTHTDQTRTI